MASHAPGTVTTATILCTDVVGSTETRTRLGEELADRVFEHHHRLLRTITCEWGSAYAKSRGDGIMVVFPSATAGLEAIIAIEEAIVRANRTATAPLTIRAALSAGDVSWGEDDIGGLPPVEAARLLAVAGGDQVLCTDVVCLLAQGRCRRAFRELGPVRGKGLPQPLLAYELMWRGPETDEAPADGPGDDAADGPADDAGDDVDGRNHAQM
jgi:class 3 adenylate cyclase